MAFKVKNISATQFTVQGQNIDQGQEYEIPALGYAAWGKDKYLHELIYEFKACVVAGSTQLEYKDSIMVLRHMGAGDLV